MTVEDAGIAQVSVESTGESSMVRVSSTRLGSTPMTIRDGGNEYHYLVTIRKDAEGNTVIDITPQNG